MPLALQLPRRRLGGEIIAGPSLLAQFGMMPKSRRSDVSIRHLPGDHPVNSEPIVHNRITKATQTIEKRHNRNCRLKSILNLFVFMGCRNRKQSEPVAAHATESSARIGLSLSNSEN
jgi:hypothetical protein